MATDHIDPEKGQAPSTKRLATSSWTSHGHEFINDGRDRTPLELFQLLVGIHTPPCLTHNEMAGSSSTPTSARNNNVGLYRRAQDEERRMKICYFLTSYISNTLYMLQILLAATFTALSAYKDTHPVVLTVLGAINTVLAGCLAWQKGQGVPQRYRKARDQYQALILEIETAERSFISIGNNGNSTNCPNVDPYVERERLQKLFDVARADQQANYPDLYVSTGAHPANEAKDSTKQQENSKTEATTMQSELVSKVQALVESLESRMKSGSKGESDVLLPK